MPLFWRSSDPRLEPPPRIWGAGVFDNDIGVRVRDQYLSLLVEGRTSNDATRMTMEIRARDAYDIDFRMLFWTTLAQTQWLVGHLEQAVVDAMITYMEMGGDGPTMRSRADLYPARERVVDDLRKEITMGAPRVAMDRDEVIRFVRKTWGEEVAARLE